MKCRKSECKYHRIFCCEDGEVAKVDLVVESNNGVLTFRIMNTGTQTLCKEFKIYSSSVNSFVVCDEMILPGEDYVISKHIDETGGTGGTSETVDKSYVCARVTETDWVKSKCIKTNFTFSGYDLLSSIAVIATTATIPTIVYVSFKVFNKTSSLEPARGLVLNVYFPEDPNINNSTVSFDESYPEATITDSGIEFNIGDLNPGEDKEYIIKYPYINAGFSGIMVTWSSAATALNRSVNPKSNYAVYTIY